LVLHHLLLLLCSGLHFLLAELVESYCCCLAPLLCVTAAVESSQLWSVQHNLQPGGVQQAVAVKELLLLLQHAV
jgi:hypothetical protein